jgi:hypothetical protein
MAITNQAKDYIMSNFNPSLSALDRLEIIVRIIGGDEVACSHLEKLLSSAEAYFCKVFEMETRLKIARLRLEGEELRALTENLDKNRRYAHEALIADLHIFNRFFIKEFGEDVPVGGIFNKDPDAIRDRIAVADWAGELLTAVYQNRKR